MQKSPLFLQVVFCSGLLVASSLAAGDMAVARHVVALSGMMDASRKQFHSLIDDTRRKHPEIPASTWNKMEQEAESQELDRSLAKFWSDAYTTSELKQIESFLSTATGKKFFRTNPSQMPRMSATVALEGIKLYGILQTLHPDKFPRDPKQETQVRQLFEVVQTGANPGGLP